MRHYRRNSALDDTEALLLLAAVGAVAFVGYKIYENVSAGLSWAGNAISSAAAATGAAISSAASAENQANADVSDSGFDVQG